MSLISQNAIIKDKVKNKAKRKDDEPSLLEGHEEILENEGSDVDAMTSSKKRKKEREAEENQLQIEEEIEMKKLGNYLFGAVHSPVEFAKGDEDEGEAGTLFIMDRSGSNTVSVYKEDADEDGNKQRKPAWVDDDEEKTTIDIAKVNRLRKLRKEEDETVISGSTYVSRLRTQHEKLNPGTDWAHLDSKEKGYTSDENDILRTNEELVVKRGSNIIPGTLEYSRLVDANAEDPSSGPINCVQFHRNHQLLLCELASTRVLMKVP